MSRGFPRRKRYEEVVYGSRRSHGRGGLAAQGITLAQNKPEIDSSLKAYAAAWSKANNVPVTIKSVGGSSGTDLGTQLKADFAAGDMPDIFVIRGIEDYKEWADLTPRSLRREVGQGHLRRLQGRRQGLRFPGRRRGLGPGLQCRHTQEGRSRSQDPRQLRGLQGRLREDRRPEGQARPQVRRLHGGFPRHGWVTGDHDFNSLLSNGLPYGDKSVTNDLLAGKVDAKRLSEYADWVELLFKYADKAVLTTGQLRRPGRRLRLGPGGFPPSGQLGRSQHGAGQDDLQDGLRPPRLHGRKTDGIFVAAPSYYVINKNSKNVAAAKKFLNDLVYTDAGNKYMVVDAGMIPAYKNVKLSPSGQLSSSVQA